MNKRTNRGLSEAFIYVGLGAVLASLLYVAVAGGASLVAAEPTGPADGPAKPDLRVKGWLDQAGIKYEIADQSQFRVVFQLEGGRSQSVVVNSATEALGASEIREIWSVAAVSSKGGFSPEVLRALLAENQAKKLGAWSILARPEGEVAIFSAKVPADLTHEKLVDAVQAVLETADAMEKRLTRGDDY